MSDISFNSTEEIITSWKNEICVFNDFWFLIFKTLMVCKYLLQTTVNVMEN